MAITVETTKGFGIGGGVNGTGRRPVIRGFYVCRDGRPVRAFAQGSGQKWTVELEAKLRAEAEEWAEKMRSW